MKTTERGWAGHFCAADGCKFRRNTLVEHGDRKIVVSTVGNYVDRKTNECEEIGHNRCYETMVFESNYSDTKYYDADVCNQIDISCQWRINFPDADDNANVMHDDAVEEIKDMLLASPLRKSKRDSGNDEE